MAASVSLYRKYRSQTFEELVGQEPVVKTLKNAIATGRIGHAYLFTGPRGVGKTSAARLLARAANCLATTGEKPCNECSNCLAAGREIATDLIEIDAASNTGVDNIREVIERAQFSPSIWHTKFYIIDEVHMLSVSAFNALLKTLEEPPPQVAFILATTEVHKVPATVASRCQRFDFRRVPLSAMVARLRWICEQEAIQAEDAALELVARQATGSLRDALSLMDQLRVFSEGEIKLADVQDMLGASGSEKVADFVDCMVAADLAAGLRLISSVAEDGLDIRQLNRQIVEHLHSLMLVKSGAVQGESGLIDVTEEIRQRLNSQAANVTIPELLRWIKAFAEADSNLRTTNYRQLPLEMALVEALTGPAAAASVAAPVVPEPNYRAPQPPAHQQPQRPLPRHDSRSAPEVREPLPPPIHADLGDMIAPATASQTPISAEINLDVQPQSASSDTPDGDGWENGSNEEGNTLEGGDDLSRLRTLWPRVIDQINARSKNVAAVFRDPGQVRPYKIDGKIVTISFRYPIHANRSRNEPHRGIIEAALTRVLGSPFVLDAIMFEDEGKEPGSDGPVQAKTGQRSGPKAPAPHETPRGRAAMNIFGIEKFEDQ
ncbi:MAG: DNA polymerase III subunit gamma/tau [Chloroflexota bacterium]